MFYCFQLEGSVVTLYTTSNGNKIAIINSNGSYKSAGAELPGFYTGYFKDKIETKLSIKIDDEYEIIDMTAGDAIPADLWAQFELL